MNGDLKEKLQNILDVRQMTGYRLAKLSNTSKSVIADVLGGKRDSVTLNTIREWSKALGVPESYFLDDEVELLPDIPDNLKKFMFDPQNIKWLEIAQKAQKANVPPSVLEGILENLLKMKSPYKE